MNKKFIIILLLFCFHQAVFSQRIAIATKALGSVEIEKKEKPGFNKLKAGTILNDGDRIKTGSDGFALVIFIDDKSQLKIKEESEVTITGKKIASTISKNIRMDNGTVRAQVNKQRKGEFVIQSTTSVASVKGTDFWFIANSEDGDIEIKITGLRSGEKLYEELLIEGNPEKTEHDQILKTFENGIELEGSCDCLLYTSPSPRDS